MKIDSTIRLVNFNGIIKNCTINGNVAAGGGGISCYNSNFTIIGCVISGNSATAAYGGGGVYCHNNSSVTITNCTITKNQGNYGGGIRGNSASTITNCILWDNGDDLSGCSASYSCVQDNDNGTGNIHLDPLFADSTNGDYRLLRDSPCIDGGDPNYLPSDDETDLDGQPRVRGYRIDIGAYEYQRGIWYVDDDAPGDPEPNNPSVSDPQEDGSSEHPFDSIQEAIGYTIEGDIIIVLEGNYCENIDFDGKNIALTSTDPNDPDVVKNTIIDGSHASDPDYASTVRFTGAETSSCVLSGFMITGGFGNLVSGNRYGGGIYGAGTSASIEKCFVIGNTASWYGGGLYDCDGPITDCLIEENEAQYGGGLGWCDGPVVRCVVMSNVADGGGGGFQQCQGRIAGCSVGSNHASMGGGLSWCSGNIEGNLVFGNVSYNGGGFQRCHGRINNNVIVNNIATNGGGLFLCNGRIANCIVWDNTATDGPQIHTCGDVSYSDVQGGWPGEGNIHVDPCFADANYHLQCGSPCIDVGDPNSDYSNEPQPNGNRIDIGAYGNTVEASIGCSDSDSDGIANPWEIYWGLNPDSNDTDSDGLADYYEVCYDGNCLAYNPYPAGSDLNADSDDSDTDGMPDGWELVYDDFLNPLDWTDAALDYDSDGYTNLEEYIRGTLPNDTNSLPDVITIYVDNDAPADPEPNNPNVSDPCEDGSLEHPFDSIQEAIDFAISGDTVLVINGIYYENLNLYDKNIILTSSDPNDPNVVSDTVIDGSGIQDSVVKIFDANVVVSGFTITNGGAHALESAGYGAGVYCASEKGKIFQVIISSNIISGNHITPSDYFYYAYGGGIYADQYVNLTITNNTVKNNSINPSAWDYSEASGAGIYCHGPNCVITDNNIFENSILTSTRGTYSGGGIWIAGGIIIGNNIQYNMLRLNYPTEWWSGGNGAGYGGGIFSDGPVIVSGNVVLHNTVDITESEWEPGAHSATAIGGGMYVTSGDISNNVVSKNSCVAHGGHAYYEYTAPGGDGTARGGGIYAPSVILSNNTVFGNHVNGVGGQGAIGYDDPDPPPEPVPGASISEGAGIYADSGTVINNTIAWGNSPDQLLGQNCSHVSYCNIGDGICSSQNGNISTDPCFVNPDNDDFHLRSDSPCIDAGDPNYETEARETDFEGNPRIIGGRIDMGADEYCAVVPDVVGMTEAAATNAITSVDSLTVNVTAGYSDLCAAGTIISQTPAAGTAVPIGSEVTVVLCLMPGVPDVVGMTQADAEAAITAILDLTVNVIKAYSDTIEQGLVISQDPAGGTSVAIGSTVNIVVSLGQAPAEIYVDDDAPSDPGPSDPNSSDPLENGSQMHPFDSLQEAIDYSVDSNSVIVLLGIYSGPGNRDIDFRGKAITVHSEDPNDPNVVATTIIDCNGSAEDPHRGFYFHSAEDVNSVLEGFTIMNGYGPDESFGASKYSAGGAIYCNNSSPTIRKCLIRNNYAGFWGGGFWFSNSYSFVETCTFQDNDSGDTGGGLYNRLAGITVKNCLFVGNSAPAGGGIYNVDGAPTITNTIFAGNLASLRGGAGRNNRAAAQFLNCTFYGNCATEGGALHNKDSEATIIKNSILWGNDDGGGIDESAQIDGNGSVALVNYSCVQGWTGALGGTGNFDADPCFAELGYWDDKATPMDANDDVWVNGDYHLKSEDGRWDPNKNDWVYDADTSPCIDAGDPNSDWAAEPWPNGKRINMGAYGGTDQASMNGNPCDFNVDGIVDFADFCDIANYWRVEGSLIEDLDYDNFIDFADLRLLSNSWLWQKAPY